jgi:hypothetical protein
VPNGGIDETVSPQKLPDNKWTSALDVEPLFDGVRLRPGSSKSNTDALQAINLSYEGGTSDREFNSGNNVYISQSFTVGGSGISVFRVAARLKDLVGNPTGNIAAAIYTDDAGSPGKPNVVVPNADFGDFSEAAQADIGSEYKWFVFEISSPGVSLSASTIYHLVLRHSTAPGTGTDNYSVEEVTTPSGYAGGNVSTSTDASIWVSVAAADLNFRIYAGAANITAIADYRLSDATTSRHLVVADGEVYKNVSGTMTAVSSRDRLTLTAGQDTFPSWVVGQDRWLMTNNTEISKKFYVLSGTEYYENEGIAAPTAVPTVGESGSGNTTHLGADPGEWEVDYYYYNEDLSQPSDRKYQGVAADSPSATISATGEQIDISNLPATTVRENDRATHIYIEVKAPSSNVFRYITKVAIGTTTATITDADFPTTVEGEYEHAVAPIHEIKEIAENRQFIGNIASFPYRVMYSAIIGATPYYESFPATNTRDFGKGDGDYITALAFVPPRSLVVGFKNSIWAMDPRRPGTSDRFLISDNVGIAGHLARYVVGNKLFFVSDAETNKGIYVWNGRGEPQLILGLDDTFKGFDNTRYKYASTAHLAPGDNRFQWWFTGTSTVGGSEHDRIVVYDYVLGAYTVYKKGTGNVLGNIEESGASKVYLGGTDGFEYLQDSGTDDAGTSYIGKFTMKAFDFKAAEIIKRLRFVDFALTRKTVLGSPTLEVEVDYGEKQGARTTLTQDDTSGTSFTLGTSTLAPTGTDTLGSGGKDSYQRSRLRTSGRVFQPTVTSNLDFYLKLLKFGFQGAQRSE